jgi:hypothetical protein
MDVGRSLRVIQASRNVRNVDLARSFKVPAPEVTRWRRMQDAKLSLVKRWATFFGMTIDEFISYE